MAMEQVTFGRTGVAASVMGLGCGGHSRLGQRTGHDAASSVRVVREAIAAGVNIIDTAESYQTESIVGEAIASLPAADRDGLILCTKKAIRDGDRLISAEQLEAGLDESLRKLGVDCLDVYQLHGVQLHEYEQCRDELLPAMMKLRDAGKLRWIGLTEWWQQDPAHAMLDRALDDDCWDTVMVGHNFLNCTAGKSVLPKAINGNVGVMLMMAVRRALCSFDALRGLLDELESTERIDDAATLAAELVATLIDSGVASSLPDAAYRYARHSPGVHVVLSGTGSVDHLHANAASINRPDLPADIRRQLDDAFARVDHITGN